MLRKHVAQVKAQQVLKRANQTKPAINLRAVTETLGIHYEERNLEDSVSGFALIKENKRYIFVNQNHSPNRRRFTWAHEIGHHVLHESMLKGEVHVDKRVMRRDEQAAKGTQLVEIEANNFAAELLMPTHLIEYQVSSEFDIADDGAMEKLATLFEVSPAALYYRLVRTNSKSNKRSF